MSKIRFTGLFIILITIVVLIAGCTTTSNTGESPPPLETPPGVPVPPEVPTPPAPPAAGASPLSESEPAIPINVAAEPHGTPVRDALFSGPSTMQPTFIPTPDQKTKATAEKLSTRPAENVVNANNRFAFELYSQLVQDPGNAETNIFFSPFSLSSAMALAYEGANGTTADEIGSVFHFPTDKNARREQFRQIFATTQDTGSKFSLLIANALWAEKTYRFRTGYLSTGEQFYDTKISNLDFKNSPEDSRATINTWVEEKTAQKIRNLLPQGSINPLTRLVITNAVYFKGTWVKPFSPASTHDDFFTTSTGSEVKVRMMVQKDKTFTYTENNEVQVLEMPYEQEGENSLSMIIVLPGGNGLSSVENSLDAQKLAGLKANLSTTKVEVYLPKFKVETACSLDRPLADLGMPTAFTREADFSGMDGTKNLSISSVLHKAYVDVYEEGTEAAAATAISVGAISRSARTSPTPVFRADHPFVFFIQDTSSGNILFMGRITNPNR